MNNDRLICRAKTLEGEWVYGMPHTCNGKMLIVSVDTIDFDCEFFAPAYWWIVDPATLGQSIGRRCKNGTLVFTGDIVWARQSSPTAGGGNVRGVIAWNEMHCAYVILSDIKVEGCDNAKEIVSLIGLELEVIGNAIDHPELLKGESQ